VAIAIVRDGAVIYLKGHGVRSNDASEPVTPDTLFPIASCTKAFTTTAMAVLVDEGKMDWDDPVRKHLDWFRLSDPLADRDVTVRDLLCHRTGLARHDILSFGTDLGRDDIVRRMAHVRPAHPFRSTFEYNNNMYTAAGQAVGAAAHSSWAEVVEKRLFAPLGFWTFLIGFLVDAYVVFRSFVITHEPIHQQPLLFGGILLMIFGIQFFLAGLQSEMVRYYSFKRGEEYSIRQVLD